MTSIPNNLHTLLNGAFDAVTEPDVADKLRVFATQLYERAYLQHLHSRTPEDNRKEHELVVLRNTMQICWRSGGERRSRRAFDIHELRIAVATSLLHDLRFIARIMEEDVKAAKASGDTEEFVRLEKKKAENRLKHMKESAELAAIMIRQEPCLMTEDERQQCVGYIALHDAWKMDLPYPASTDWVAVCCFEGDVLWPLDTEFGPHADLERAHFLEHGNIDGFCPTDSDLKLRAQLNLNEQMRHYRNASFASVVDAFQDDNTVIRTSEGARILSALLQQWGIT